MKTLTQFLNEALLTEASDPKIEEILSFIENNYDTKGKTVTVKLDKKLGTYVVNSRGYVELKDSNLELLTNGEFIWGSVLGLSIDNCNNLTSLQGYPININGRDITISNCDKLESLEGITKELDPYKKTTVFIEKNKNLKSYEYLPKYASSIYWVKNGVEIDKTLKKELSKKLNVKNSIYTERYGV